jgi:hypothetical protein
VDPPCFGIYEFGQPSPLRTLFDDLPGTVPVYSEDQSPAIPYHGAAAFNILFEHVKSVIVDGQDSLASVLLLFSSASRPKFGSTNLAGKLDAAFEVLYDYRALGEVYVLDFQS